MFTLINLIVAKLKLLKCKQTWKPLSGHRALIKLVNLVNSPHTNSTISDRRKWIIFLKRNKRKNGKKLGKKCEN